MPSNIAPTTLPRHTGLFSSRQPYSRGRTAGRGTARRLCRKSPGSPRGKQSHVGKDITKQYQPGATQPCFIGKILLDCPCSIRTCSRQVVMYSLDSHYQINPEWGQMTIALASVIIIACNYPGWPANVPTTYS